MCTTTNIVEDVLTTRVKVTLTSPKKKIKNKCFRKVKFTLMPTIIIIEDDDEDRKGPWEIFAVDRDRFNRRILNVESQIGWCFQPKHRENIFNQRLKVY
ncbi:hypothetical protein WIV_gp103 [Wiseana iridescent virus]|uniref:Protein DP71L n=1 Tax=Wiseana iridescent virus TaxID=68347 RepID=G0T5C9_IRV9|nr:hypothetical protein WIV_gp103 [Wiseana iridescent virus]ADO00447.1 hypothetical protein [Wiseana iridescent virus]